MTPRNVLEEYESLVREAGYNPGAVLPSMIAALGVVDASRPTMVIKVERGTTTFAIVDNNQLLLYRALENGGSAVSGESLVDDVNTSLVYFEDRYAVGVDRVLVTGVESAQDLQEALERDLEHSRGRTGFQQHGGRGGRQRAAFGAGRGRGSAGVLMRFNINLASQPYEAARHSIAAAWVRWCSRWPSSPVLLVGYIVYQRVAIARHQPATGRRCGGRSTASTRRMRRRGPC